MRLPLRIGLIALVLLAVVIWGSGMVNWLTITPFIVLVAILLMVWHTVTHLGSPGEIERDEIPNLHMVGKTGVAQSNLYPRGAVFIEGKAYEARSRTGPIDEGTPIRIMEADQFNLIAEEWLGDDNAESD